MEPVERCPGQLAATNAVHRRRVSGAPRIGQLRPIHLNAFGFAELPAFADDRVAPVHDSSEHIEYKGLYAFHTAIVAFGSTRSIPERPPIFSPPLIANSSPAKPQGFTTIGVSTSPTIAGLPLERGGHNESDDRKGWTTRFHSTVRL